MTTHHHRKHVIGPPTTPGPAPEARQATSPRLSRPAATSTEAAPPREPSRRPPLPEPIQRAVIAHLLYRAGTLAMQVTGDPDQVERAQVLGADILTIQLRYGTIVDFPPLSRHSPWLARVSRLATIDELLRTATQMMRVATHGNPSFAPLVCQLEAMTDSVAAPYVPPIPPRKAGLR